MVYTIYAVENANATGGAFIRPFRAPSAVHAALTVACLRECASVRAIRTGDLPQSVRRILPGGEKLSRG